jgi:Tol biopolymer transport system component
MGVIARPLPVPSVPWRSLGIVALLAILAAATLLYAGSRQRPAPPFGLARNGALIIGTTDGDIVTVDPASGKSTPLISGPTIDSGPFFSLDGQRILFDRATSDGGPSTLFTANADGSDVRAALPDGTQINWFDWSPNRDQAVFVELAGGKGSVAIADLVTGARTAIPLDLDVFAAKWRPNHDQLIVTANAGDNRTFWVVNADGTSLRPIPVSEYAINEPALSSDGRQLAYATWEPGVEGRIRVVDIDSGGDRSVTTNPFDGFVWQVPSFSPDGTNLVVRRFLKGTYRSQLAILPVDGVGPATAFGPETDQSDADPFFSPDGTEMLVQYPGLKTFWIFDAKGQNGHEAPFASISGAGATWQRLAP